MRSAAVVSLLLLAACSRHRDPLPVLFEAPAFELTDQTGARFSSSELRRHVWIADFIYTTCPGPCPRMTSHMRAIQDRTPASVHLVSFTVDPENDTPPVLTAYAKKYSADPARWRFLTGDKTAIAALGAQGFKLSGGLDHDTHFVLIDKRGRIRGYYGTAQGSPVEKLVADAEQLTKEGE